MDLLISILFLLGIISSPDPTANPGLQGVSLEQIEQGQSIIDNEWYHYNSDGGVVIDNGVGT